MRLPFYRFLNAIWKWCVDRVPPADLEEWIRNMNEPLNPAAPPTPEQLDREGEEFLAAMSALTGASPMGAG